MRLTVFFTFSLIVLPGSTVLLERLTQSGRIGAPTARAFIDLRLVRETVCGDRGMIAHSTCSYQFGKLPLTNIPLAVATCVVLFYALVLLAINLPDGRSRAIVVIAKVVGLAICILTALLASTVVVSALLFGRDPAIVLESNSGIHHHMLPSSPDQGSRRFGPLLSYGLLSAAPCPGVADLYTQ